MTIGSWPRAVSSITVPKGDERFAPRIEFKERMSQMRRITVLAIMVGLLVAVVPAATAGAAGYTVVMKNVQFSPSPLKVRVGDTITWANRDIIAHKIVADSGGFATTPILQPGDNYKTKITKAGTLPYHDSLNPSVKGTLIVSAAPAATPKPTAKPTARPTAKPTARPTAKPTAKPTATPTEEPTAAPTAAPEATASASTVAVVESAGSSEPPAGAGTTGSASGEPAAVTAGVASDAGGFGILTWIVLIGLVGLAFGGGIWFATMRRRPEPYRGPIVATPVLPVDYDPPAYRPAAYEPADDEVAHDGPSDDDLMTNPIVRVEDDR